ncbi:TPA: tail fiber assembly protein [Serratia marcescens]|uniref:tail fiber assembly protein n=1 Tax=Serratia marcescens TaxID=615 RepID=UPI0011545632|nr:tail fiber assembly protein [Serratia marcescens]QDI22319.1 tail fiber assembly protein [Serratia marcescens]HEM7577635.1 tail fiber assembly protein [Serratia marcescens]
MYQFSASTGCFYPDELLPAYRDNHSLPADLMAVGEEVFFEFTGVPPEGKQRGGSPDGKPAWVDVPPLTKGQLTALAAAEKEQYRIEAEDIISPLARAEKYGIATSEELSSLESWEKYSVLLNRINPNDAPDITWPEKPKR